MLVSEIMKAQVITVSPLATVRDALRMMNERGVKSLVVEKRHPSDAY
ncbi:MAG TPA: CBS domain-containing protein, partial [Accumulibacter sp.]|nr:CBS domain-containing protein [Accumulibacter sp.]